VICGPDSGRVSATCGFDPDHFPQNRLKTSRSYTRLCLL
jgi:hypothetical protein